MITIIRLKLVADDSEVHINVQAIDSVYCDSKSTYGILLRSGIIYHISKEWYNKLLKELNKE